MREYVGWGAVPDEVAECMIVRVCEANAGVVGYTADDARESLRGRMEEGVRYKVVIHVGDVRADGVGGTAVPPSPSPLHTHTHMAGADKRRTVRRPTTSRWSAGSLAEMQRHMAGRGGGDGVTYLDGKYVFTVFKLGSRIPVFSVLYSVFTPCSSVFMKYVFTSGPVFTYNTRIQSGKPP